MGIIIFFAAVIIAVGLGSKFKINYGVIAFALVLLIGTFYLGEGASAIIGRFPVTLFFNLFIVTAFYGFANENGALEGIASRIIYRFRTKGWLMPFVVYGTTIVVSGMGAGAAATPIIMSAIAFSLAIKFGYHPILASMAVWMGSMIGDSMPWTSSFASNVGRYIVFFDEGHVTNALTLRVVWYLIIFTAIFAVVYFVLKANKVSNMTLEMEAPKPFTQDQKKTLIITGIVIGLILVPGFCQIFFPNPVTAFLKSKLSIQLLTAVGTVVMCLMKLADFNQVLKNRVPWGMIVTICGMTHLMALSKDLGVADFFGAILQERVPAGLIVPALILITGILTYFVDGQAVTAIVLPMLPVLVEVSGTTVGAIMLAYLMNVTASFSPFSTGGAMALSGCPEELRQKCINIQIYLPWILLAVSVLIGATGLLALGTPA